MVVSNLTTSGQKIRIENSSFSIALPLIGNNLNISIEDEPCDDIVILSDNGTILKTGIGQLDCQYIFTPTKFGKANFIFCRVHGADTVIIAKETYKVGSWPDQKATFAGIESGSIPRSDFFVETGVHIHVVGLGFDARINVRSYQIKVIRNRNLLLHLYNTGEVIEIGNRKELEMILAGDLILFEEIKAVMPGEEVETKMNDIRVTINKN